MCRETKRITPFNPKPLTKARKLELQDGLYASRNFTNHAANKIGLASWTDEHRQAWELACLEEMGKA